MSLPANPKLHDRAKLAATLHLLRESSTVIFTNGCFDILHPGHVDLLQRARALGDILVLGLNSDDSVRRLKGPTRPINALAERAFVLAGLSAVDYIAPFEEDTPLELIRAIQPDVLIKGGDWPVEKIVGREVVEARGGTVLSLPLLPGYATTDLVRRICALGEHRAGGGDEG